MQLRVKSKGKSFLVELAHVIRLSENAVILLVNEKEFIIPLSIEEHKHVQLMLEENYDLLLPFDMDENKILFDAEVPEMQIEELQFDE